MIRHGFDQGEDSGDTDINMYLGTISLLNSIGLTDHHVDGAERGREDIKNAAHISHKGKTVVPITERKWEKQI